MSLKTFCCILAASTLGLVAAPALAVNLPHTFQSGEPARASEVNDNFQALENAVNHLANSGHSSGNTSFGDAYDMQPSTSANTPNVKVLAAQTSNGGTIYRFRVYFKNTNHIQLNSGSGTTTPQTIHISGIYKTGPNGKIGYRWHWTYAPTAGAAEVAIDSDGDGTFEFQKGYGYSRIYRMNPLANSELVDETEIYSGTSGVVSAQSYSFIVSPLGRPLTVNGKTYNNVIVRNYISVNRTRFRAKGIGLVLQVDNGSSLAGPYFDGGTAIYRLIYYRIQGQGTWGSLKGTPFKPGNPSQWLVP